MKLATFTMILSCMILAFSFQAKAATTITPAAYLDMDDVALDLLDIGALSECQYAELMLNTAYRKGAAVTGWEIPNKGTSAQYAAEFTAAVESLDNATAMIVNNNCATSPNGRCCTHNPLGDQCDKKTGKNCKLHPSSKLCDSTSQGC